MKDDSQQSRKPRVALMGEFSAGKSTLTNVLLGRKAIPVRVTATNLPPVWISEGEDSVAITDHDGHERPATLDELETIGLRDAAMIRITTRADILTVCDLIDMPGISDPNMDESVWTSALEEVDCVVWCTHATQAWRQSEASVWERTVGETNGNNFLLVSQIDKLTTDRDRDRVLHRVRKETDGMFRAVMPLSLSDAARKGKDCEVDSKSDLGQFFLTFVEMLMEPFTPAPASRATTRETETEAFVEMEPVRMTQPINEDRAEPAPVADDTVAEEVQETVILPRRVAVPEKRRARPPRGGDALA